VIWQQLLYEKSDLPVPWNNNRDLITVFFILLMVEMVIIYLLATREK